MYDIAIAPNQKFKKGDPMAKTYTCRDVGVDCDWKTRGTTDDEVLASISEHAAQVHPAIEPTPELLAAVRGVIKDKGQNSELLQRLVSEMAALEHGMEEAFDQWMVEVLEQAEVANAIRRFRTMVKDHREALDACLQSVGDGESEPANPITRFDLPVISQGRGPHKGSDALHAINTAFNQAAFGYAKLHTVAHRFNDRTGEGNASDLAEQHQRAYSEASQAVYRLLPDVLIEGNGRGRGMYLYVSLMQPGDMPLLALPR